MQRRESQEELWLGEDPCDDDVRGDAGLRQLALMRFKEVARPPCLVPAEPFRPGPPERVAPSSLGDTPREAQSAGLSLPGT